MTTSKVDVLIVGAGPAGLFLATQLSKLKISARIIDKMAHPVLRGHADGLQCRTGEVFEALGVQSRFAEETHECAEVIIWDHDDAVGGIKETSRVIDTLQGLSRIRHVNLGQDRVEAIFIDAMQRNSNLAVERLLTPTSLVVDESKLDDPEAYPVTVTIKKLPPPTEYANGDVQSGLYRSNLFNDESTTAKNDIEGSHIGEEVVQCKYLVGCDGARSWVRKTLGLELKGDSANVYWAAFDAVLDTDLPTSRMKHVVHSKDFGTVLMVPREDGMVRIYTQMGELKPGERVNRAEVTLEKMLEKTANVLKPYNVSFPYVDWYTVYEIGQRVCDTFAQYNNHVLIAGDACHTHSPKAGQGMNVSMMDTYNLGWKLASVLRGQSKMELVGTYHEERQRIAQQLIDFDREFSASFTGKGTKEQVAKASDATAEARKAAWEQSIRFTSGTGVVYQPDLIVLDQAQSKLAKKVIVGSHFENHQVVGAYNAHTLQLQAQVKADGRWRVVVFPGDIREDSRLAALKKFGEDITIPIAKFTPKNANPDAVIDVLTVFATPHRDVQLAAPSLPAIFTPRRAPYGVKAFDTFFCDEESHHDGHGHAYEGYGVDPAVGAVVIVRPDQYVSGVFGLEQADEVAKFFERFMIVQQ